MNFCILVNNVTIQLKSHLLISKQSFQSEKTTYNVCYAYASYAYIIITIIIIQLQLELFIPFENYKVP